MKPILVNRYPGRQIRFKDRKFLYFGGTAYLGMQVLPRFQNLLASHIKSFGTNYGSSRLSNIQLSVYEEAEHKLSEWTCSKACITMSSGYLAGQLLASYFRQNKYKVFHAPNAHSSLYLDAPDNFRDYNALGKALEEYLSEGNKKAPVLFLDTIDFSGMAYPDFSGLRSLPLKSCILVADDSHGMGITGKAGGGSFGALDLLEPLETLVCTSLGKALGLQAGAIFGSGSRLASLKETAMFAGASPASPACMATLLDAIPLYALQRQALLTNIDLFTSQLQHPEKFRSINNYPAFAFDDPELVRVLHNNEILITDFDYPADDSNWQSRIVLSALHRPEDISKITNLINVYYR